MIAVCPDLSRRTGEHAGLRDDGNHSAQCEPDAPKNSFAGSALIRWSVQEIHRIAIRLAQCRIQPAHVIAWSLWRRADQAEARKAHLKSERQLQC
jgi:hypothetical protein